MESELSHMASDDCLFEREFPFGPLKAYVSEDELAGRFRGCRNQQLQGLELSNSSMAPVSSHSSMAPVSPILKCPFISRVIFH